MNTGIVLIFGAICCVTGAGAQTAGLSAVGVQAAIRDYYGLWQNRALAR